VSFSPDFDVAFGTLAEPVERPPCSRWIDDLGACCGSIGPVDQGLIDEAIDAATEILWALSGRRYLVCPVSVRPCVTRCSTIPVGWSMWGVGTPWPESYRLLAALQCHCPPESCGCVALPTVVVPGPIFRMTAVWVDGQQLPSTAYRVDSGSRLTRLDGQQWPACSDLAAGPTDPGSFIIDYERGRQPPEMLREAARVLACELVKSCTPGADCALPQRVTSITRQGVSFAMLDPMDFMDNGRTGLYAVDLALAALNPHNLTRGGRVYRADALPSARTVW